MNKFKVFLLIILISGIGLVFGLYQVEFLKFVEYLGLRIPSRNLQTDYLIAVLWAMFFAGVIFVLPGISENRKDLLWMWLAKSTVTLGAMLFYEYKYGLDAYNYYYMGLADHHDLTFVKFGLGTNIISYICWLFNHYLPVFDSYHSLKVIFSAIGFAGVYFFYRGIVIYTEKHDRKLLYILGFFPSVIFWSSILGKDPITLFGICLYAFGVLGFLKKQKTSYFIPILVGVLIATSIRVWAGVIFLFPLVVIYLLVSHHSNLKKVAFSLVFCAIFTVSIKEFVGQFEVESADVLVQKAQYHSKTWSHGGSGQNVADFRSVSDMLKFAPIGVFTALFRPLPGEVNNVFGLLAGLENMALLVLLVSSLYKGFARVRREPVLAWIATVIIVWALVYGFVSSQNLGSAARFKLQVLPFMLGVIYLMRRPKIETDSKKNLSASTKG